MFDVVRNAKCAKQGLSRIRAQTRLENIRLEFFDWPRTRSPNHRVWRPNESESLRQALLE